MRYLVLALALTATAACSADRAPVDATQPPADSTTPPAGDAPAPTPPADDTTPPPVDDTNDDTPPPPADSSATVPARFQGEYATDAAACASAGHASHLAIDADRIAFHEAAARSNPSPAAQANSAWSPASPARAKPARRPTASASRTTATH